LKEIKALMDRASRYIESANALIEGGITIQEIAAKAGKGQPREKR